VTENSQEQEKTQNYSFQWNAHLSHWKQDHDN
jgi:hypothetical protein